ncbi:hypothetical protein XH83_27040 [Bradyrhizobium sp. CCBAU 53351]|nr:hypothetical protein XH83_27040 [Bradyrhizobium sp. CCBAU 53351]
MMLQGIQHHDRNRGFDSILSAISMIFHASLRCRSSGVTAVGSVHTPPASLVSQAHPAGLDDDEEHCSICFFGSLLSTTPLPNRAGAAIVVRTGTRPRMKDIVGVVTKRVIAGRRHR